MWPDTFKSTDVVEFDLLLIFFLFIFYLVSALLRDYSLFWDRWKRYMTPTLDAALLICSRAGAVLLLNN